MKTECLFVGIVAASLSLIGCARQSSEAPLTPASGETQPASEEAAPTEDLNEGSDARQCVSNEDCGKGYVCGFDPEQSRVVRHCMAE